LADGLRSDQTGRTTPSVCQDFPDAPRKGRAAAAKRAAGEPVTGLPTFLAFIGMEACEKRVRTWLGQSAAVDAAERMPADAIDVGNTNLVDLANQNEALLIAQGLPIYRRGPELVRVRTLDTIERVDGIVRHEGLTELTEATPEWMAIQASEKGTFYRRTARGSTVRVAPSPAIMKYLHETVDERRFPPILGLSMTPTLDRDHPGYDPESRLLLAFPAEAFPEISMQPSRDQAEQALRRLVRPLRGFPFVDDGALAVALSAFISGVVRRLLRTCPLHAFDAPAPGSGKTKLTEMAGILATGVPPSGIAYSPSEEENDKRLVSLLRAGDPVILFDNITGDFAGDTLCTALTQETIQARILGLTQTVRLSTRSLMLATGNNLRLRGDLTRRAIVSRLDAKMANPEERVFDFDAVTEVRAQRPQLVADVLTVLRAYIAAGRPAKLPAFGSFEDWNLVRGALVWLGHNDPLDTKAVLKAENPDLEEKAELIRALLREFGIGQKFMVRTIGALRDGEELKMEISRLLRDGRWDHKRAGHLLRKHKEVPFHGSRFNRE
jgi:hypothetical protein